MWACSTVVEVTTGWIPNANFSGSLTFDRLFNSFCFVTGNLLPSKKPRPRQTSCYFNWIWYKSSDTVITNPPCSCCKHWNINKHNKYCQKNKNKTGQTKNPELHGFFCVYVFVCVCVCIDGCELCVCLPCDSLDELEIYNTGFYSKPWPKTVILSPLFSSAVGRQA